MLKKILILCFSFYFSISLLGLFLRGQLLEVIITLVILWVVLRKLLVLADTWRGPKPVDIYHLFVAGPTAAGVDVGVGGRVAGMLACPLTVSLVTPSILGVTCPVNTSLGAAGAISLSCTTLQDCQLLLSVDQRSAEAVRLGCDERREEGGEETNCQHCSSLLCSLAGTGLD